MLLAQELVAEIDKKLQELNVLRESIWLGELAFHYANIEISGLANIRMILCFALSPTIGFQLV